MAEKPTLRGKRVLLRPVGAQDVDSLLTAINDPEIRRLTGSHGGPHDADPAEQRRAVHEWYTTRGQHSDRLDLAVVDRGTGRSAGEIVLNQLDRANRSCNLRIMLVPASVDRGLGTEAMSLLLDHAFDTVGLHRISLEVFPFNPRARHVYEKVGFVVEGVMRDALYWDGEWVTAITMSILSNDPRPAR